eukprot:8384221-Pyramimonas_sp.AAC.1
MAVRLAAQDLPNTSSRFLVGQGVLLPSSHNAGMSFGQIWNRPISSGTRRSRRSRCPHTFVSFTRLLACYR